MQQHDEGAPLDLRSLTDDETVGAYKEVASQFQGKSAVDYLAAWDSNQLVPVVLVTRLSTFYNAKVLVLAMDVLRFHLSKGFLSGAEASGMTKEDAIELSNMLVDSKWDYTKAQLILAHSYAANLMDKNFIELFPVGGSDNLGIMRRPGEAVLEAFRASALSTLDDIFGDIALFETIQERLGLTKLSHGSKSIN